MMDGRCAAEFVSYRASDVTPPAPAAALPARATRAAVLLAALATVTTGTAFGQAQPGSFVPQKLESASEQSQRPPAASETPVFGLLKPEDGSLEPLPPGTGYKEFVEWVAAKRGPGYGINSVKLTVRPSDGQFEADAEVRLVVIRKGEWVRVPLAFDEAVLLGFEHEGEGTCSFSRRAEEGGLAWSFDSAGEHTLKLDLLLPAAAASRMNETRLSLTTPVEAAVTTVGLTAPTEADVNAASGIVRSAKAVGGKTEIDWVGPGGRIEFSWRPKPVAAELADLTVSTTIFPAVSGKAIQLRAVQRISAAKGQITSVKVLLPAGFALTDVTGTLVAVRREEVMEGGRAVTVELSEPTAGPFELTWKLAASMPTDGSGAFTVEGFSLPGVPPASQSGRIVIEQAAGYEIDAPDAGGSEGVRSLAMVDPGSLPVASAYEFVAQPFRLKLRARVVPPEYSVGRELTLRVAPEEVALDSKLAVQIAKGELRDLKLTWPATDWTVTPGRAANLTESKRTADPPGVELRVAGPASSFSIPVRATLARAAVGTTVRLPLPRLEGASAAEKVSYRDTLLFVRHGEDVAVEPAADGSVRPLDAAEARAVSGLPEPAAGERWSSFKVSADAVEPALQVRRLPRAVTADALITVRSDGDGFRVTERIDYAADRGLPGELRFRVPREIASVSFTDGSGVSLTAKDAGTDGEYRTAVLTLGKPEKGEVAVTAEYRVDGRTGSDGGRTVSVPVIVPLDASPISAMLRVTGDSRGRQPEVESAAWVRAKSARPDEEPRWTAARLDGPITLRLVGSGAGPTPAAARLLLRSAVDRDGVIRTVADCRLDRPPRRVAVRFADGVNPVRFQWREQNVTASPASNGRSYELDLGGDGSSGVLRIETDVETERLSGLAERVALSGFEFVGPDAVAVQETMWQVTLPESQHLFNPPGNYTPRFRWALTRGLWARQTDEAFRDPAAWLGAAAGSVPPEFEAGHQYVFSRSGPADPLAFTAISRSLVVLIGAGAAIVIGYAFAHGFVPRPRAALAALLALLLLLWAFFPGQVQIFLQPAAFGLLLVAVAAFTERLLRTNQESAPAPETPPSAVDFVTILPGESSTSGPPAAIGSEEPTVLRPGRPAPEAVGATGGGSTP